MNRDAGRETKVPITLPTNAAISMIVVPMAVAIMLPVVAAKDLVIVPTETETDEPAGPGFRSEGRVRVVIIGMGRRPVIGGPFVTRRRGDDRVRLIDRDVDDLRIRRRDRNRIVRALVLSYVIRWDGDRNLVVGSKIAGGVGLSAEALYRVQDSRPLIDDQGPELLDPGEIGVRELDHVGIVEQRDDAGFPVRRGLCP